MKQIYRKLSLALAGVLCAASLAGCGAPADNSGATDTAGASTAPASASTPPADASTPPADASTPPADASTPPAETPAAPAGDLYISVVAKGFQHQFWQVVKKGSDAAAKELGVQINFVGPEGESATADQVNMLNAELDKKPNAICLAALDTQAVLSQLKKAQDSKIPVIGFDSGVPEAPAGQVAANASTNNEVAAALGADHMYPALKDKIAAGKTRVCILSQDATSASITGRTKGFAEKLKTLAEADGKKVAIIGGLPSINTGDEAAADLLIEVVVGASAEITDMTNSANGMLSRENLVGVFCSNEGAVNAFLAAINSGAKIPDGLVIVGFDAGKSQKAAVQAGQFLGSITQDPYSIGYKAVELAVKAAKGEAVSDVDTGAKWYDKDNMAQEDIAQLLYD